MGGDRANTTESDGGVLETLDVFRQQVSDIEAMKEFIEEVN